MSELTLETPRLRLVLQSTEAVMAFVNGLPEDVRAQVSPAWIARVQAAKEPDPWTHAFNIFELDGETELGQCAFKGPPDSDGCVEIAYGVEPEHRGKGIATEAAAALTAFALGNNEVRGVIANTMEKDGASARVLTKCGFEGVGQVVDPEDGPVWRWEKWPANSAS